MVISILSLVNKLLILDLDFYFFLIEKKENAEKDFYIIYKDVKKRKLHIIFQLFSRNFKKM